MNEQVLFLAAAQATRKVEETVHEQNKKKETIRKKMSSATQKMSPKEASHSNKEGGESYNCLFVDCVASASH